MKEIVIESQYLPGIAYFALLVSADKIIVDRYEHYVRQTYRNRAEILGSNGVIGLTVPVTRGRTKQLMKNTKVDNTSNWQKVHWRSIRSAYGKSPFFEFYEDQLAPFYEKRYTYLTDLNHDVMSCMIRMVRLDMNWSYSENYIDVQNVGIQDYRSSISPKNKGTYLEKLSTHEYPQVFGSKFVSGMSLIDLLFCEGPNAGTMIRELAESWQ